jgi:nucleoside 2-deoxyribosyltransferase
MSKIYLASSWKMAETIIELKNALENEGHEVDAFCDESGDRISFNWSKLGDIPYADLDAIDMMKHSRVIDAFNEDKKWLDWADTVILVLPSGRSAHLEAGYAKGSGKNLLIYGGYEKGEFDVMYGFANKMFRYSELDLLIDDLKRR